MALWINCIAKVNCEEVPAIYRPRDENDIPAVGEKRFVSVDVEKCGGQWTRLQCPVELVQVGELNCDW